MKLFVLLQCWPGAFILARRWLFLLCLGSEAKLDDDDHHCGRPPPAPTPHTRTPTRTAAHLEGPLVLLGCCPPPQMFVCVCACVCVCMCVCVMPIIPRATAQRPAAARFV